MATPSNVKKHDVMIIGTGMTGMAAALFAAQQRLDTVQAGITGEINFASGLLDLFGVHPVSRGCVLTDPWRGLAKLIQDEPLHPYAKLEINTIRMAMRRFVDFLAKADYPYSFHPDEKNLNVITPAGTIKPTYGVPHTMQKGAQALALKQSCLLVDFKGLKGYSARQIALALAHRWPNLKTVRLEFPDLSGELYTERMARSLEEPQARKKLAQAVLPHIENASAVGFPSILGVYRTKDVLQDLERLLGVNVFEIPTMLPTVTGLRLREIFEQHLPAMGVQINFQQRVLACDHLPGGHFRLHIGNEKVNCHVLAKAVILASGRFLGKGLRADRNGIHETLFNLPVHQPSQRSGWHHKDLFHQAGHPINRSGVQVDKYFRPANCQGRVLHEHLFAAGSILAHQDWIRQKCGSGLAIATAYAAVKACKNLVD
ncbi:MAG: anaerobic glycerol-3-phosphate dehydrogenase subunit B [Desulfobacteraceae bacterium]|nr:anaerobic glycerol-3-phosphate dehydrogenase subunit B [Desulfobacteraceae bacterium]